MWWWAACWSAERQIAVSVARLKSHKEMWREVLPFGLSPRQQQLFNCWWALSNLYVFDLHQLLNIDRYFKAIKVWNQQMDLRLFRLRSVTRTNSSINHRGCYQLDNSAIISWDMMCSFERGRACNQSQMWTGVPAGENECGGCRQSSSVWGNQS